MKKLLFALLRTLLLPLTISCTSMPPVVSLTSSQTQDSLNLFWKQQERKKVEVQTIQAKIRLDIVEKKRSLSGVGTVFSSPEGLRLELRDPLGSLQYAVVLQGNKDSTHGANYLKEFLNLGMNFYDLKNLWLGVVPITRSNSELEGVKPGEKFGQHWLNLKKSDLQLAILIDVNNGDVLKVVWQSPSFAVEFEFSDFASCCKEHVPSGDSPRIGRNVFLKNGNQESEIELDWVTILSAKKRDQSVFELDLPANVKKVFLN
ncbi:MAG: DUF4292 domain-containing protein [Proteobacteria bacterium]|nr:DUF4292 domain-containing protein [Pseudomonadota bacterium]